jgi:cytochrome c oxidase cbb3-type subunit 3
MKTGLKNHLENNRSNRTWLCLIATSLIHFSAFAQGEPGPSETVSVLFNPLFIALLVIAILLLIAIVIFADVVKAAAYNQREKDKKKEASSAPLKTLLVLIAIGYGSNSLSAQTSELQNTQLHNSYYGLDSTTFYVMLALIGLEIFIAWSLYGMSMQLLGVRERQEQKKAEKAKLRIKQPSLIEKINASVAIEEEEDIMLDHNYDGIRELDNNLPPWWKYGFYLTILFAVVYLIHFHVINTGKLQIAEYEDQLTEAKLQMETYKKKAANLIDESNATVLTDEASLTSGKSIFLDNCAACHGRSGEGGVGPNLTDDYWLHEGGIKNIFKTIKYGWPEKGMKSWQQDLGAKQIHEVASYIKSLHGTNPTNAKEKQGELYKETTETDSTKTIVTGSMQPPKEDKE